MTDKELIETIAEIWVENGGDADGIEWCREEIKEKITAIMIEKSKEVNK